VFDRCGSVLGLVVGEELEVCAVAVVHEVVWIFCEDIVRDR